MKVAGCHSILVVFVVLGGCAAPSGTGDLLQSTTNEFDFQWSPQEPSVGQLVHFRILDTRAISQANQMAAWFIDGRQEGAGNELWTTFPDVGPHRVSLRIGRAQEVSHIIAVLPSTNTVGPGTPNEVSSHKSTITATVERFGVSFVLQGLEELEDVAWDFGDGNVSAVREPNHFYAKPGDYWVRATTMGPQGVVRTLEVDVMITAATPRFELSSVGFEGGEPTVGVTSSGCIFFQANAVVARSCDLGTTWESVNGQLNSPNSRDPFLWVDPATDRIFSAHLEPNGECIWIAWSDDDGDSWLANPADCGPIPFADHQKLVTGPRVGPLEGLSNPLYDTTVYLCFNRVAITVGLGAGIHCHVSLDGGATFPILSLVKTGSGLHGSIQVGPDGALYVPARTSPPTVYISQDGALSWTAHEVSQASGVQDPTNDPEIALDEAGRAFLTWVAEDDLLRIARSPDGGQTWEPETIPSPDITSVAFPVIQAGAGIVAAAFLGTTDFHGNPQDAPADAQWNLYVAWSSDAVHGRYFVQRVTTDPVQVGPICMATCSDGSRNLLDFIDINIDKDGRLYIAFADGCVDSCVTNPAAENSRTAFGVMARQAAGPFLSTAT